MNQIVCQVFISITSYIQLGNYLFPIICRKSIKKDLLSCWLLLTVEVCVESLLEKIIGNLARPSILFVSFSLVLFHIYEECKQLQSN